MQRLDDRSRMSGDVHVRFCERLEGRFLWATRLVILCKGGTEAPMRTLNSILEVCGLQLNEKKTSIVDARETGFDFLGFHFQVRRSHKSGKGYPHVEPSKRSIQGIEAKVKALTHRCRTPVPLALLVKQVNQVTRGWCGYFHYGHSTKKRSRVKWFTEEHVRKQLRKRYKVRTRTVGYSRFSTDYLYGELGLYKIPTTAKWKKAHAV